MDSAKPIYKYLSKQNSQVVDLITHGMTVHKINNEIKDVINQHITTEWQLGQFSGKELTLLINSTESANRLRFQLTNVLQDIRKLESCKLLNKIKIKVRPEVIDEGRDIAREKANVLQPSKTGEQELKSLATHISDPALKASLQRLANRVCPED